jgi:hypothetical protein
MAPTPFDLHLLEQGKEIEELGQVFLKEYLTSQGVESRLTRQRTFIDGNFQARVDALVLDPLSEVCDLYEIKSSTSIDKEDKYDVAFQRVVCEASIAVRSVFIVHVNKDFVRKGAVDGSQLFVVVKMDEEAASLRDEVAALREEAYQVSEMDAASNVPACFKPKDCPCPELCHPVLPRYSIYDLPRLQQSKARDLREGGVLAIEEIPDDFPLTPRQRTQVSAVSSGKPTIQHSGIRAELEKLEFPLYFLDYETFNPAVPWFDGYRPYQHIVFQYSLHILASRGDALVHYECLDTEEGDPAPRLVGELAKSVGQRGSVVVWNKAFETGRNTEMAARYPDHREVLENMNARVFDLMEIFSKGLFVHPDFHGSASLKAVLPVLVQDADLNYAALQISQGAEAMLAWREIMTGETPRTDIPTTRQNLLRYCELDTLAMVKCWEAIERYMGNVG